MGQAHLWKDPGMWVDPDGSQVCVWAALCLSILCFSFLMVSVSLTGDPLALSVFTQPFEISHSNFVTKGICEMQKWIFLGSSSFILLGALLRVLSYLKGPTIQIT